MKKSKLLIALAAAAAAIMPATSHAEAMYGNKMTQNAHVDWSRRAVIYEVNLRQGTEGRTINSMKAELPRLKELGVDILWLMPIHPISELNRKGGLGSYYAVADYKAFNPEFGTMDDMKEFVKAAHDLGMKVIIDEVCNHSGCDNPWVTEHPEYYKLDENGKMFGPFDWTDTYKLDYDNPELREAMLDALKFWVRDVDIDGYRCDVAMEVPTDFWNRARQELLAIKPVFMLAEASKPELTVAAFDCDYNWPMRNVFDAIAATQGVNQWAKDKDMKHPQMTALAIDELLAKQKKQYPKDAFNMNMITNHDLNSWEGTEFDRYGDGVDAFAILSYTLPGMPMMYSGQEVGMNHAWEFFVQDTPPNYTPNRYTDFYKTLNNLKHTQSALEAGITGGEMVRYPTKDENVYAFSRKNPDSEVFVIVNLSNGKQKVEYSEAIPVVDGFVDIFTDKKADMPKEMKAWEYRVFVKK